MLPEFLTATTTVKQIFEIVQGIKNLADKNQAQQEIDELLSIITDLRMDILALQDMYSSLQERYDGLQKENKKITEQREQFTRYFLHQLPTGSYVYLYQPVENDSTPPHAICASCQAKGIKSILQKESRCLAAFGDGTSVSSEYLVCPICKHEILSSRT